MARFMGKRRPPTLRFASLASPRGSSQTALDPARSRAMALAGRAGLWGAGWSVDAVERVADGAHRAQQIDVPGGIERFAQPPDMDIDGAHLDLGIVVPYRVEQLLARE